MYSSLKPSTKPMKRGGFKPKAVDYARTRRQRAALKPKRKTVSKLAEWSKAVKANAIDGLCQRCGLEGHHAHHVAPRSRRPDLRLEVNNGVWICHVCHLWVHDNPKASTAAGWLSDVPYEMRDEVRVKTGSEERKAA